MAAGKYLSYPIERIDKCGESMYPDADALHTARDL
ncbi:hypothetical protein ACVWWY_002882 [Thermostichus sp. OS-CIW-38]